MALNNEFKVKNNLNTLGQILSSGVDILDIFAPSNTTWTLSAVNANFGISGADTLTLLGDNGISVTANASTESVLFSGINATTASRGVASFTSDDFTVTNGQVAIKTGGVSNAQLETASSANLANNVVIRGGSGEFSSGSITATGNLSASDTITGNVIDAKTGFRVNNGANAGHVLRGNGTDFVSSTLDAADLTQPRALTKLDDSNVTLTLTGSPNTALLQNVGLVLGWNGQLPITRGGTGSDNGSITGSGPLLFAAGGTNQDITFAPSGTTGKVNISSANITSGAINGTTIGLTVPAEAEFTNLHATGNVSIDGSLFVTGTATTINTVDLVIADPIIYLAEGNQGDIVDMGFTVAYNYDQTPTRHAGFLRNNVDKKWVLFSNLSAEVLSATNIDFDDPSLVIDTLRANIEGTITGNVSGTATQAVKLVTGRTISTTGDVTYTSGAFDGTANVTGTATIANNVVTYSKIQQVGANKILGNPTGSSANVSEIDCTSAGRALLSAADTATQRNTLGLGTAQSVTFADVTVDNGTKSVLSRAYNNTVTSGNTLTVQTFADASFNSAKFTVQIKDTLSSERCVLEILATKNDTTWEGTVYGIVDPEDLFTNVDIGVTGSNTHLEFTFNGVSNYSVTVFAQAISD